MGILCLYQKFRIAILNTWGRYLIFLSLNLNLCLDPWFCRSRIRKSKIDCFLKVMKRTAQLLFLLVMIRKIIEGRQVCFLETFFYEIMFSWYFREYVFQRLIM